MATRTRRTIRPGAVLAPLLAVCAISVAFAQQPPEPPQHPEYNPTGETLIHQVVQKGDKCFDYGVVLKFEGSPPHVTSTIISEREIQCPQAFPPQQVSTPATPQGQSPIPNSPQPEGQQPVGNWPPDVDWVKPGQNGTTYEHHKDGRTVIRDRDGNVVGLIPAPVGTDQPPVKSPTPIRLTGPSVEPNPNVIVRIDGTFHLIDGRWVRGHFTQDGRWISEGEHKTVNIPLGSDTPQKLPVGQPDAAKMVTPPSSSPRPGSVTPQDTKALPRTLTPTHRYGDSKTAPRTEGKPKMHKATHTLRSAHQATGVSRSAHTAHRSRVARSNTMQPTHIAHAAGPTGLGHSARPLGLAHAAPRIGGFGGMRMGRMH